MTVSPAGWAAAAPTGESSNATARCGSTPRRAQAARCTSGAGLGGHAVGAEDREVGFETGLLESDRDQMRRSVGGDRDWDTAVQALD